MEGHGGPRKFMARRTTTPCQNGTRMGRMDTGFFGDHGRHGEHGRTRGFEALFGYAKPMPEIGCGWARLGRMGAGGMRSFGYANGPRDDGKGRKPASTTDDDNAKGHGGGQGQGLSQIFGHTNWLCAASGTPRQQISPTTFTKSAYAARRRKDLERSLPAIRNDDCGKRPAAARRPQSQIFFQHWPPLLPYLRPSPRRGKCAIVK